MEIEAMRNEFSRWLANYRPQEFTQAEWTEDGLDVFVRSHIARLERPESSRGKKLALPLARLGRWCLREGIDLDIEQVLDPDTVERYCTYGIARGNAGDYRSMLRYLGVRLTVKAAWEPSPVPLKRRAIARSYDAATLKMFSRDAARQATAVRGRTFDTILSLGLGAGLDGRWVHKIHGVNVTTSHGVVLVDVPAPAPRIVAVLAEWEDLVLELARLAGTELLLGGSHTAANFLNDRVRALDLGKETPRPSLPRLRSTWLVAHLSRGTRLSELAAAAGMEGITSLSDLLPEVPRLSEQASRQMLRGA